MRIYFIGSHATGKTTMTRYVSRTWGLPMITEVARSVLSELESSLESLRTDMELVAEYQEKFANPYIAAARGYVDEVIEPRHTREKIIIALDMLKNKRDTNPPKKHGNIPL